MSSMYQNFLEANKALIEAKVPIDRRVVGFSPAFVEEAEKRGISPAELFELMIATSAEEQT